VPELTVSMPAYNCETHIYDSVLSVLNQQDVDFEFIVVDDCSNDNTVNIISSINDRRLLLIRNKERIGKYGCYNLVIQRSNSAFITHINPQGILIDKFAFKKILNRIKESTTIGQVHSYDINADYEGNLTRRDVERRWINLQKSLNSHTDYRRDLIVQGNIINKPTTYRKEVFDKIGLFNDALTKKALADFEMTLRILDKYEVVLLQEFLCCNRKHMKINGKRIISEDFKLLVERTNIAKYLLATQSAKYLKSYKYNIYKLYFLGFLNILSKRANTLKQKYRNITNIISSDILK